MTEYNREEISQYCKLLGFYFICLILGSMNMGALGSLLKLIALLPIGIWILTKRTVRINKITISIILFVGWTALSYIWTINSEVTYQRLVSQFTFMILMFSVAGYLYNDSEVFFLKKCLIWSSRLTALVLLLTGSYIEGRLYLSGIIDEDPNYLCGYFLFAVVWCIEILLDKNTRLSRRITSIVELFLYAYLIFSTGSRGGLFAIVTAILVEILFQDGKGGKVGIVKKILIVIIILAITTLVSNYLPSEMVNRYAYHTIINSGGTGRYDIWNDAINAFLKFPFGRQLIGYGAATFRQITFLYPFRQHNVAHNIFIENLAELGVIGLIVYLVHLISYVTSSIRKRNTYSSAILIGLIMLSMSTSIQVFKPYWNLMAFVLINELRVSAEQEGT